MKVAISCDEYCARVGDNFYLREFGQILVNRYLMVFDEVRLIVRTFDCVDINECGKFNKLVQDSRIEIYPITFFQGPKEYLLKKFNIVKLIRKSLYGCDTKVQRCCGTSFKDFENQTVFNTFTTFPTKVYK